MTALADMQAEGGWPRDWVFPFYAGSDQGFRYGERRAKFYSIFIGCLSFQWGHTYLLLAIPPRK